MSNKNINKIVLVSLCDNFSNQLAFAVSERLEMLFCDTKQLVEYELVDRKVMEDLCSVDYLKACERRVIKHIASFENIVVSIDYEYLVRNFDLLKENSLIVFVSLSKAFVKENEYGLNFLAFEDRTKNLQEISDISMKLRKTEISFAVEKVVEGLRRIL